MKRFISVLCFLGATGTCALSQTISLAEADRLARFYVSELSELRVDEIVSLTFTAPSARQQRDPFYQARYKSAGKYVELQLSATSGDLVYMFARRGPNPKPLSQSKAASVLKKLGRIGEFEFDTFRKSYVQKSGPGLDFAGEARIVGWGDSVAHISLPGAPQTPPRQLPRLNEKSARAKADQFFKKKVGRAPFEERKSTISRTVRSDQDGNVGWVWVMTSRIRYGKQWVDSIPIGVDDATGNEVDPHMGGGQRPYRPRSNRIAMSLLRKTASSSAELTRALRVWSKFGTAKMTEFQKSELSGATLSCFQNDRSLPDSISLNASGLITSIGVSHGSGAIDPDRARSVAAAFLKGQLGTVPEHRLVEGKLRDEVFFRMIQTSKGYTILNSELASCGIGPGNRIVRYRRGTQVKATTPKPIVKIGAEQARKIAEKQAKGRRVNLAPADLRLSREPGWLLQGSKAPELCYSFLTFEPAGDHSHPGAPIYVNAATGSIVEPDYGRPQTRRPRGR